MNSDLYCLILEDLLDEAELNEFSTMAGGAVGGYAAPADAQVGTGIDVEKRDEAISYNEGLTGMSPETPYTGPELSEYPYQSNP